jgi:cytochrome c oxidase cbb3-type subunit 3
MRFEVLGLFFATALSGYPLVAQQAPVQAPSPPAPATQGPPAPAPGGRGRGGIASFPAQQRPPADPAMVERGRNLYSIECRSCHGPDLRGGESGGPNLLRSPLVLNDLDGELMLPVIQGSRKEQGMPAINMTPDDVRAVAAFIRSVLAAAPGQGAPPPGPPATLNVLVGDPSAGKAYFEAKCSSCHSVTGDLSGIGARDLRPIDLQNLWVAGGRGGRGRGAPPAQRTPPMTTRRETRVTVTLPTGQRIQGRLERIDDFLVTLTQADGTQRSFRRDGDVPKVEVQDPLEGHRNLLPVYTDKDIHDVTAYLASVK